MKEKFYCDEVCGCWGCDKDRRDVGYCYAFNIETDRGRKCIFDEEEEKQNQERSI